jgi:enolase
MPKIASLHARQILDSRGNPTIEVDCELDDGSFGRAAVPSGASTGKHEALELRDDDPQSYAGKSVGKAVQNVNTVIAKEVLKKDTSNHRKMDEALLALDGTKNKSRLGANAILGSSMAIARARAGSEQRPLWQSLASQYGVSDPAHLPVPLMNVLNGGKHADSGLSFQECMIVPIDFTSFSDALRAGVETYHVLKGILSERRAVTAIGDEGGFAPRLTSCREALTILVEAIERAGYAGRVKLALDAAASEFFDAEEKKYRVDGSTLSSEELVHYYRGFLKDFPVVSIEDSHAEDDWAGFIAMQSECGAKTQLVGDDIFVTNVERMREGIEKSAANAVLIKLNQIGTVSETVDAISLAKEAGWRVVVSHRSGETEDTFIAHLAVALNAGQIKTGAPCRSDRTAKYNQLLRIEEQLGDKAEYRSPF